jgi:protein involved in polysaccharide export with SLBB domain
MPGRAIPALVRVIAHPDPGGTVLNSRLLAPAAAWLALVLALAPVRATAQTVAPQDTLRATQDAMALQPGDLLRLAVWREPDMSGEYLIDESGNVTLPLLGVRRAAGVPLSMLRGALIREYQAELRNPSITIIPLRRVNVLGEVNKPGVYPVDLTATVSDVLALAGGINPLGDPKRVSLVRRDGSVAGERIPVSTDLSRAGIRSGDQVVVGRRSWFDRNSPTVLATSISLLASAISTLIIYNKR